MTRDFVYPSMSSSLLLCEALGFSPQLLLDDIINIANNAVQDGVNGMEEFFQKWAAERGPRGEPSQMSVDATTHEVEQGLVAFQTLLEYHTDIAFDFFEAWCLRNVFMVPPDLPIVLPHQAALDLTVSPDQEEDLIREVNTLRKRLDNVYSPLTLSASTTLTNSRCFRHANSTDSSVAESEPLPRSFPSHKRA